jgi:hypothetical protein
MVRLTACIAFLLCYNTTPAQTWNWVDDDIPGQADLAGEDGWNWTTSPAPVSGMRAHQSAAMSGAHQHYFFNARETMPVATGDRLFVHVYLDPSNMPREIMLQWNDGSESPRAGAAA